MNGEKTEGRKACRESFAYHRLVPCLGIFALSYVLKGKQIRRLAAVSFKVLDRLRVLRSTLR
jgi:hypothetical protein